MPNERTQFDNFATNLLLNREIAKLQECILFIPEARRTLDDAASESWKRLAADQIYKIQELIQRL